MMRKAVGGPVANLRHSVVAPACDVTGLGGSCPSPNARCHEYCDDVYDIETLECMAGKEGILDWQRNICHGKATVRMGVCHLQCDRDYPH